MSNTVTNMLQVVGTDVLTVSATKTATTTSSACDTQGYDAVGFWVIYGVPGDTLSTELYWEAKLQSCTTESGTYEDVSASDVESDITGQTNSFAAVKANSQASKMYGISYKGSSRWVKVVITPTGTHTYGTIITVISIKDLPRTVSAEDSANP